MNAFSPERVVHAVSDDAGKWYFNVLLRRLFPMAALAAALFASAVPATAGYTESHIYTKNETKVWVWVTAYTVYGPGVSKIQGAWCVGPDQYDQHGLHASIREVRFEITKNRACAHPVLLDKTEFGPTDQAASSTQRYTIREEGGRFIILGGRDRY